MEWYIDWRFLSLAILLLGSVLTNIGTIIVAISNRKTNIKIMTNDLIHIAKDLKDVKANQKTDSISIKRKISQIWKVVNIISEKQIARDALCKERHGE